jgi:hypothetical protein
MRQNPEKRAVVTVCTVVLQCALYCTWIIDDGRGDGTVSNEDSYLSCRCPSQASPSAMIYVAEHPGE